MLTELRPLVSRGDVWLVALEPTVGSEQGKTRPCVVVQRDSANRSKLNTTIVVPFTDAAGKYVSAVRPLVNAGDGGLAKTSVGMCDQVRVVDRLRLRGARLGSLTVASMAAIDFGLIEILDLERNA